MAGAAKETPAMMEVPQNIGPNAMPLPSAPGSPCFNGRNISDFLKQFSDLCRDYKLTNMQRIAKLPHYCGIYIAKLIKTMRTWREGNWDELLKTLREDYKPGDLTQKYHSRRFLEAFKNKRRARDEDPGEYIHQFENVSEVLIKKRLLDNFTRILWFVDGLPENTKDKLIEWNHLVEEDFADLDFHVLRIDALNIAQEEREKRNLKNHTVDDSEVDYLAEVHNSGRISSAAAEVDLIEPVVPIPCIARRQAVSPAKSRSDRKMEDDIERMTKDIGALTLSVRAMQTGLDQTNQALRMTSQQPRQGYNQPRGNPQALNQPRGNPQLYNDYPPMNPNMYARDDSFRPTYSLCNYCKRPGHLRKDCKVIEGNVLNSLCHLDEQNYLCLGPYLPGACAIRMQPNMSQRESVIAAQPLCTPRGPDPNADTAENGKPATGTSAVTSLSVAHSIGKDTTLIATDNEDYSNTETFCIGNIAAASTVTPETQTILKRKAEEEAQFGRPKNV